MIVCRDHYVVVSWREVGKKEFAGLAVQHRRTNDLTVLLRRDNDIRKGLIDKTVDTIQFGRNDLDHWLELVCAIPRLHNRMTGVKIQQEIDPLPGIHGELMDQFDSRLHPAWCLERDFGVLA